MPDIAWEDVDEPAPVAWEDIPDNEGTPTQGVTGPSGDAGERAPAPPPKEKISFGEAIDANGPGSIPGVGQLSAAANAIADYHISQPPGRILENYQAYRQKQEQRKAQGYKDWPKTSLAANLGTNLGVGMLVGPALEGSKTIGAISEKLLPYLQGVTKSLPTGIEGIAAGESALPLVKSGVTNLAFAQAAAADEGRPQDVGKIALEGAAIGAGLDIAKRGVVKYGGKLLKGAQNSADDFAAWVGRSKIGKWIGADNPDVPSGPFKSERVRDLEKTIAAGDPDFGATAAKLMSDAETSLGSVASSRLDQLNDAEKQAVAQHFADLIKERGAKGVTPAKVMENWEAIVNRYVGGADKGTAMDLLKGVNKRDVKWLASAGAGIEDTNRVLGITDEVLPEVKDMFSGAQRSRAAAAEDRMNRFGQAKAPGEAAGTYQVDVSKIPASEQDAYKLGKAAFEGRASIDDPKNYRFSPSDAPNLSEMTRAGDREALDKIYGKGNWKEGETPFEGVRANMAKIKPAAEMLEEKYKYGAASREAKANFEDRMTDTLERAKVWRDRLAQLEEAKVQAVGNAQELARLEKEAQTAKAALHAIGVGRAAIENAAGGVAAVAGGTRGMLEAAAGAMIGKPVARGVFKGIDMAGAVGQRLSQVASIAERLATMDNEVGRAARWALSAEGDNALTRMAILAKMPEVQDEMDR